MTPESKQPQEYVAILKRRAWQFAIPFSLLLIVTVLIALLWPPTYQSSATILIEEPDVPRDLVASTISSFAAERVQVITQRVMTTSNLVKIIGKYDLYAERRTVVPIGIVVEEMRQDLGLELINADVIDPRSGRATQATIAFNVTFNHRSPGTAQTVLNELVSLYLGENLRTRRDKAAETTEFLKKEAAKYSKLVSELEARLADFKQRNAGTLPEDAQVNVQLLERTDRELIDVRRAIQALEERRIYLQGQLAQLEPYRSYATDGVDSLDPAQRLRALETEFLSLSGVYGPEHPDVRRLAREIEAVKREVGVTRDVAGLIEERNQILTELATARDRYSEEHPDVKRLKRQLESAQSMIAEVRELPTSPNDTDGSPDNPAYIQILTQLEATKSELTALAGQRKQLQQKLRSIEERLKRAPQVEQEYLTLRRDYENVVATYREIKSKLTAAEIGESLEEDRKSERFALIEPPTSPTEPVKPNRLAILFIGFVFSIAFGGTSAGVFEAIDQSIYGPRQLAAVAGAAPLVTIPYISNPADVRRAWTLKLLIPSGTLAGIALTLFLVNEFYMPLDVLWAVSERRLELFLLEIGFV